MAKALITLVIQDADADTSTVSVFVSVETGDTVTTLSDDYAHVLWDVIYPIVTGVLVDVRVSIYPDFSGWTNNTPDMTSDVQEKAIFMLRPCTNDRVIRLSIPTIAEEVFTNSGAGKTVDFLNADVMAFVAVMTFDLVDGGISAIDSHGIDICQVISGEQFFGGL